MIPELRKKFNSEFSNEKYEAFLKGLNSVLRFPVDFRVSETPLFLSDELTKKLLAACNDLCNQIQSKEFKEKCENAVPESLSVSKENDHPQFFVFDFAICKNDEGVFYPKLIELQGFPTLYGYQYYFDQIIKKHFDIPENLTTYFNGVTADKYAQLLKDIIVADSDPKNVILLEIEPEKQKTRIDFAATEELTGIQSVCISDVIKRDKKLYYKRGGREIPVERIYNRLIFDELNRTQVKFNFDFRDEIDVIWIPHPNWFYKISKNSLPVLKGKFVPKCFYLKDLRSFPDHLENYVLKPLFSFAGLGVKVDVTKEMLESINDPENYILQEKVEYAPLIETPDGYSKCEIRMMFIWDKEPVLVNNLVRMSKGKMMGVDFNKNKTWVGSSTAFHSL
jgi:hypothetical protein